MYCNILLTKPFNQLFTYKSKIGQQVKPGSVVIVPFGAKKLEVGLVYSVLENKPKNDKVFKIKYIHSIINHVVINHKIIEFVNWISDFTLSPKGSVLKLFLVNKNIIDYESKDQINNLNNFKEIKFNFEQQKVFNQINKFLYKKFQTIVLQGVTGSGKTEVYFNAIQKILVKKNQILIMLPEISLTPQLEIRFKDRFGFTPEIWHSKISEAKKKNIWHNCLKGSSRIILGARSSLFLPFKNLGLIIVDEEHDSSFKQEENIRYNARDLAIVKSKIEKIPIILSSATPSLETHYNIFKKKYFHVFLPSQYSGLSLPAIEIIDMKKENLDKNKFLSKNLINNVKTNLDNRQQVLLFLNRRGYSPLVVCRGCGYKYHCENCSSFLVMHKNKKRLVCHHCGLIKEFNNICHSCRKDNFLKFIGPGVEKLEEEVKFNFPKATIKVMSSDTANTPAKVKKIVFDFEKNNINILIATQLMAKGYHFSNLSLVGIIDADSAFMGSDMRAMEKTYNLLEQVGGRAGRERRTGKVIVQSYFEDHPIIKAFEKRDRKDFINKSLIERKKFSLPPYVYLTSIIVSGSSKNQVQSYCYKLSKNVKIDDKVLMYGPVEAPFFLLRGKYRYRFLFKSKKRKLLNNFVKNMIDLTPSETNIKVSIDVDPQSFS